MKLLLIFPKWLGKSGDYCHHAARSLGWDSTLVWGNYHDTLSLISSFYCTVRRRALIGWAIKRLESQLIHKRLIATADTIRPDIIINNCPNLLPDTIEILRRKTKCLVYWAGDDPALFPSLMRQLHLYDHFFAGAPNWITDDLISLHQKNNHYLPYGCEPTIFRPLDFEKQDKEKYGATVSFVGARYSDRERLLATLTGFDLAIWGWKKDNILRSSYRRLRGQRYSAFHVKYGTDEELFLTDLNKFIRSAFIDSYTANKIYNTSAITLNLQHPQMFTAVNSKTFEIASAGGFQLFQHTGNLLGLFEKDREIVCFEGEEDLREKITYFVEHPEERQEIANRARLNAISNHTFEHRLRFIFSTIGG
jgi:spore maturation protein CgeB